MTDNSIQNLRNIAIIAHVDHGKTTLVDQLLKQSDTLDERTQLNERAMDSNDLEKERGITILAKNTAIRWRDYRINIVDTPGHADFGGEVERILSMVDAVLLLVDAAEGPMPQTRFVTQKAFAQGLKPIVVINKIDREGADPDRAVNQVFDLFVNLEATDEQLDFPVIYASALNGFAIQHLGDEQKDMTPLFETIVEQVSPPDVDLEGPFQMQISQLDYSSYVGAIGIGRIKRGTVKPNQQVIDIDAQGSTRKAKILQVLGFMGLDRHEVPQAQAGDIVAITGIENIRISDTLCDPSQVDSLPALTVDEPTISMTFQVNNSPFAGKEGKFLTSRQIKDRLERELISNVALRVKPLDDPDKFLVSGRGELHLGILLENMRREGYELAVSRPEVIVKEIDGQLCEPYENVVTDLEEGHQGDIMQLLAEAKGDLKNMEADGKGRVRLEYTVPTRGLIGFHTRFLTLTSGSGLMYHSFDHYGPKVNAQINQRSRGVLVCKGDGTTVAYALFNLQERGKLFVGPQVDFYEGMIIGVNARAGDMVVNPAKAKQLTNIRAAGSDENVLLTPPVIMSLEKALDFIADDELVEITPVAIRLRKKYLKEVERKRLGGKQSKDD